MRFFGFLWVALSAFAASPRQLATSAPIRFEPNRGQVATTAKDPVLWMARGLDYAFLFTEQSAIMHLGDQSIRMRLGGASTSAPYQPDGRPAGNIDYLTARFRERVPTYTRLRRHDVYPGVDLVYYGNGEHLEYDFELAPGADSSRIQLRFEGSNDVRLNETGDLIVSVGSRTLTQRAPVAYQLGASGDRWPVDAAYRMNPDGSISIAVANYDRAARLVIDPEFVYTRYLFGTSTDTAIAVAHDNAGFIYLAGNTQSFDFKLQGDNFYSTSNTGTQDGWVMKLNPRATDEATRVPYTSYVGELGVETVRAMAVDPVTGFIYLAGSTTSTTMYPPGGYQTTGKGGTDAFLAVLDPTKSLVPGMVHFTFFGGAGNDEARGVAVFNGKAYITGSTTSTDLPTKNPIQAALVGGAEIFVAEFDPLKTGADALIFSTYITGGRNDYARAIAVDPQGKVYIAGVTYSPTIPVTSGAFQANNADDVDAFLLKLDVDAKTILYGTYLGGGNYEEIKKIVVEPSGRVAITGYTLSPDFPITQNAHQTVLKGIANAFLTIIDPAKAGLDGLVYSTLFGGSTAEVAYDLARDITGKYYLVGYTLSEDLRVTNDAMNQVSALGGTDGFFAVLDPAATNPFDSLIYSTYITSSGSQIAYGVDVDLTNTAYIVGSATNNVFPEGQATRTVAAGNSDGFLAALQFPPPPPALLEEYLKQQRLSEVEKPAGEPSVGGEPPVQDATSTTQDATPSDATINTKGWFDGTTSAGTTPLKERSRSVSRSQN